MADKEDKQTDTGWGDVTIKKALERELDAALAKYAAVEPRVGLEERVLANLRAQHSKAPGPNWWRWSVAAELAAVVAVGLALAWRSGNPSRPMIAGHSSTATPVAKEWGTQVPSNTGNPARPQVRRPTPNAAVQRSHPLVLAAVPKLDQFPSPQPLSEQEKILASYVARYPENAALIAEARMEALQRDREEELREAGADSE